MLKSLIMCRFISYVGSVATRTKGEGRDDGRATETEKMWMEWKRGKVEVW